MMLPVAVIKEIESTYSHGRSDREFIHDVRVYAVRPGYGRNGRVTDSDLIVHVSYIEEYPVTVPWPDLPNLAIRREPRQFKAIYGIVDGKPRLWAD